MQFLGASPTSQEYFLISSRGNPLVSIEDLPSKSVIYYDHPASIFIVKKILTDVYGLNVDEYTFTPLNEGGDEDASVTYVDTICDTYDIDQNVFLDYVKKTDFTNAFLFFGLNNTYNEKLKKYFETFYDNKRTKKISLYSSAIQHNTKVLQYESVLYRSALRDAFSFDMENIVCHPVKKESDTLDDAYLNTLIDNKDLHLGNSRYYLELFNCKLPDIISKGIDALAYTDVEKSIKVKKRNTFKYNSCFDQKDANHADNLTNTYNSYHCDANKNYFIDILFPFSFEYDVHLSPQDFNTLTIKGDTFDGVVPIQNITTKTNNSVPRYKINVDAQLNYREVFLNDIYYGTDTDGTYSILTNSIPFEMDDNLHKIVLSSGIMNSSQQYVIKMIDDDSALEAPYTLKDGNAISVKLYEGDRVFIKPSTIFDEDLNLHLNNKINMDLENHFHGFVERNKSKLYIVLKDIRKTSSYIKHSGQCYNSNWEEANTDSSIVHTKQECESEMKGSWDVKCRYNYECPFYKTNSNYQNNYGYCRTDGKCEMPEGVTRRSTINYDEKQTPVCYNCPEGVSRQDCCEKQKNAIASGEYGEFNPKLTSPDYKFKGDESIRNALLFSCEDKGSLQINKYI
jgi:hypothetical protein